MSKKREYIQAEHVKLCKEFVSRNSGVAQNRPNPNQGDERTIMEQLYACHTKYGWLADFDGEDYRWTDDPDAVWAMSWFEVTMHANRLCEIGGYEVRDWGFRRPVEIQESLKSHRWGRF